MQKDKQLIKNKTFAMRLKPEKDIENRNKKNLWMKYYFFEGREK